LAGDLVLILQFDLRVGWKLQIFTVFTGKGFPVGWEGSAEGSIEGSIEGCASCEAFGRALGVLHSF